nr:hypothetical protein [Tanacetum cinerariifolium]
MGQDRQMQMVGGNGENQFRKYAGQNVGNLNGYNAVQNVKNQVAQNPRVQNVGNQNGLIGVLGNANQNRNGNLVAARAEGNATVHNGNQIRCYNCKGVGHFSRNCTVRPRRRDAAYLQTQLLIAQKEEAGIQLQAEEFDLMAAAADLDEIEEVNANYILMANLQQASTSGTLTDKDPSMIQMDQLCLQKEEDDDEIFQSCRSNIVDLILQIYISMFFVLDENDKKSCFGGSAGGNLLNRTPRDALTIIENKSKELVLMNKATQQATVKAIEETCVTCGGPHPYYVCLATGGNTFDACAAVGPYNQGGNGYRPQGDLNYCASNQMGPPSFPPPNVQNSDLKAITTRSSVSYEGPAILPTSSSFPNEVQGEPEATKESFADAPLHMSKFAFTFKSLLRNKEKLFELVSTPLNENCSAVLLKKFPKKLGDPEAFAPGTYSYSHDSRALNLIGCIFVDYDVDPRVPLILGRPFLRTVRALIDVYGEELTLRVNDEAITFKVRHTLRYSRGDFILEEIETFLRTPDELSNLDDDYYDTEGDILYLEKLLNKDPSPNLPSIKNEDLKQADITITKPSIEEPSELEFRDLPSHLE